MHSVGLGAAEHAGDGNRQKAHGLFEAQLVDVVAPLDEATHRRRVLERRQYARRRFGQVNASVVEGAWLVLHQRRVVEDFHRGFVCFLVSIQLLAKFA